MILGRINICPTKKFFPTALDPEPRVKLPISRQEIDRLINKVAARHDLSARLVKAVALAESGLDPNAKSTKGALGLMQLMPETAREMGVEDPYDPLQNLEGGSRYLKRLLIKYGWDLKKALGAYNWGQGRIDRFGSLKLPPRNLGFYLPGIGLPPGSRLEQTTELGSGSQATSGFCPPSFKAKSISGPR